MSAEKQDFEEVQVFLINPVKAPNILGVPRRYGHVVIKNRADGLEITQTDNSNKTQTLILHTSQLEKLKEAIEMKLEIGVGNGY